MKNLFVYSENKSVHKRKIHTLVHRIKNELSITITSLEINFVSREEIIGVNREYLGHNYPTDIITFNYSGNNNNIEGEIIISIDEARENSKKYRVSFYEEICRLVIHGILHLIGYDDITTKKKRIMKSEENKLLNIYKFILLRGVKS